jgi:hypothetical protein
MIRHSNRHSMSVDLGRTRNGQHLNGRPKHPHPTGLSRCTSPLEACTNASGWWASTVEASSAFGNVHRPRRWLASVLVARGSTPGVHSCYRARFDNWASLTPSRSKRVLFDQMRLRITLHTTRHIACAERTCRVRREELIHRLLRMALRRLALRFRARLAPVAMISRLMRAGLVDSV